MKIRSEDGVLTYRPQEGWFHFVIGEFRYRNAEPGERSNIIQIPFSCIDEEAFGMRINMFCNLTRPIGRRTLAALIGFTGVAKNLEALFKISPDLTIEEWSNLLDPSDRKNVKLIETALSQLIGKTIKAEIRRVSRSGREFFNIVRLDFPEEINSETSIDEDIDEITKDWE